MSPYFFTESPKVCNTDFWTDKSKSEAFCLRFPMQKKGFLSVLPVDCLIFVSCSSRQIVQKLFNKLETFGAIV